MPSKAANSDSNASVLHPSNAGHLCRNASAFIFIQTTQKPSAGQAHSLYDLYEYQMTIFVLSCYTPLYISRHFTLFIYSVVCQKEAFIFLAPIFFLSLKATKVL
jgi:hypothetical protein